jgi:four helix bundle protein
MLNKRYDLEDRLVKFACLCMDVCELLPNSRTGQHLQNQLSRSSIAPALLYGEVQAAESKADFIHKMKIALKELRETRVNLRIIMEKPIVSNPKIDLAFKEVNELIGIFTTSIGTAKKNLIKTAR